MGAAPGHLSLSFPPSALPGHTGRGQLSLQPGPRISGASEGAAPAQILLMAPRPRHWRPCTRVLALGLRLLLSLRPGRIQVWIYSSQGRCPLGHWLLFRACLVSRKTALSGTWGMELCMQGPWVQPQSQALVCSWPQPSLPPDAPQPRGSCTPCHGYTGKLLGSPLQPAGGNHSTKLGGGRPAPTQGSWSCCEGLLAHLAPWPGVLHDQPT